MRAILFIVALAFVAPAGAQDKPPAQEAAKPEAKAPAKPIARKNNPKRAEDARHCLEKTSNTDVIKCAEEYL